MDRGITFVAFGDRFVSEAIASAASYRAHMPGVPFALVTNAEIGTRPEFDIIISTSEEQVQFPQSYSGYYQKIRGIAASPFNITLFVDSDTYCCEPVYDLLVAAAQHGLVAVQAPRKVHTFRIDSLSKQGNVISETNTGVLGFDRARLGDFFFEEWLTLYRKNVPAETGRIFSDQSLFRPLVHQLRITPLYMTYEYNVRVGLPAFLHGRVRILHGRPRHGNDTVARFINSSHEHRIYLPTIALLVMNERTGEWEIRRFPTAEVSRRITRQQLTDALFAS